MNRRLIAALSLAGVIVSAGGATAASSVARTPVLAGTTVIDAVQSGKVAVRLSRPALFDVPGLGAKASSLGISGEGRMIGFALVAEGSSPNRVIISGGRSVDDRGRPFASAITHTEALPLGADQWRLPAGNYRLYVVTDGGPARVVLKLKGLTGTTKMRPTHRVAASVQRPEPRNLPQVQQAAGAVGDLKGSGVLFSLMTTEHPVSIVQLVEHCVYAGSRAERAQFGPGCPGADINLVSVASNPNPERSAYTYVAGTLYKDTAPLPFAQGYSLTNAGLNDDIAYTAMWLTF